MAGSTFHAEGINMYITTSRLMVDGRASGRLPALNGRSSILGTIQAALAVTHMDMKTFELATTSNLE